MSRPPNEDGFFVAFKTRPPELRGDYRGSSMGPESHCMAMRSTSNMRVELGGINGGLPRSP